MSARTMIEKLSHFKGEELIDVIDEIDRLARANGYSINVIDPRFNTGSIDNDFSRLNVRMDKESVITSFTIG